MVIQDTNVKKSVKVFLNITTQSTVRMLLFYLPFSSGSLSISSNSFWLWKQLRERGGCRLGSFPGRDWVGRRREGNYTLGVTRSRVPNAGRESRTRRPTLTEVEDRIVETREHSMSWGTTSVKSQRPFLTSRGGSQPPPEGTRPYKKGQNKPSIFHRSLYRSRTP